MVTPVEELNVFEKCIGEKLEFYPLLECEEEIGAKASLGKAVFKKEVDRAHQQNSGRIRMRCGEAWI